MPLTPKQQRFVEEYPVDLNGTQAVIRAGYAVRGANVQAVRLLSNATVQAAIQEAIAKRSKKTEINAAWVLRKLVRNAQRAAQAEPVRDKEGNPTGEYTYQGAVVNKSLELIGKHVGYFPPERIEQSLVGSLSIREVVVTRADLDRADDSPAQKPGRVPLK